MFTIYGVLIVGIIATAVVLLVRGGMFAGSGTYGASKWNVRLTAGQPHADLSDGNSSHLANSPTDEQANL